MTMLYGTGFEVQDPSGDRTALTDEWSFHTGLADNEVLIVAGRFSTGPFTGQAVEIHCNVGTSSSTRTPAMQLPVGGIYTGSDWIVSFAFKTDSTPATTFPLLWFTDSEDAPLLCLCTTSTGGLSLRRGGNAGTELASYAGPIGTDWQYLEVKVTFHGTTGSFEVRRAASTLSATAPTTIMSGTNVNTTNTGGTQPYEIGLASDGGSGVAPRFSYDDFLVMNTQGSLNNDFLGDISFLRVRPNAVGDESDFDRSTGSVNYVLVDEDAQDSDTSYVESTTASDQDLYHFEDIEAAWAEQIHVVLARPVLRKTEPGSRTARLQVLSGGTTTNGSTFAPSLSYVRRDDVWETDPATSAAWTISGFNAAQFGLQVVA